MFIGAHVRGGGALTDRLERGAEVGADAVQIFTQSPRMWKPSQYAPNVLAGYREAARAHPSVRATFCHATYLINLATPDDVLYTRSVECLINNLSVARGMGSSGLVVHIGSHKGAGVDTAITRVAAALTTALDRADVTDDADAPPCPILLENAAGAGGTVGRTLEELEIVIDAADGDERLGICIDTQHLWASGVDYSTVAAADDVLDQVRTRFGLGRLGCLHLNDSKVPLGSNRDRHENPGDGSIGADGLAALLGHPDLAGTTALLEVPGDGDGPRAVDVEAARRIVAAGIALRGGSQAVTAGPVVTGTRPAAANAAAPSTRAPAKRAPAKKAPAEKAPAEKAPAKKAPAKKVPAKKAPAKKAPAKKVPAKKVPAKKALDKKAPAKKAPAKKAPAPTVGKAPAPPRPSIAKAPTKKATAKNPAKRPSKHAHGKTTPTAKKPRAGKPAKKKHGAKHSKDKKAKGKHR